MPETSIIVRTKNEERWLSHCLSMVFDQDYSDFEVVLVDNGSVDQTRAIAQRFPLARIVDIKEFRPGLALNEGIRASSGRFVVCLSAHCIPKATDWLSSLRRNFNENEQLAGVYGRQLPVSFSDALDKRDLLTVFGLDRRLQVKDYFFHNANSMLRRSVWEQFPFDETVTNIEDRVWGKAVTSAGFQLLYDPDAAVYHHHGLHQNNSSIRAKGVVSIIEQIDQDVLNELPESMRPEHANIVAIIPLQGRPKRGERAFELLVASVASLKSARYVDTVYLLSSDHGLATETGVEWLDRQSIPDADALGVDGVLQKALEIIESRGDYPEAVLYVNHDYLDRPEGLFDQLIRDAQFNGYDAVFPALIDYGHYWIKKADGAFEQTDTSMKPRTAREPVYRALYGLGCVSSATLIRSGKLVGGKVGLLPVANIGYTTRLRDLESGDA